MYLIILLTQFVGPLINGIYSQTLGTYLISPSSTRDALFASLADSLLIFYLLTLAAFQFYSSITESNEVIMQWDHFEVMTNIFIF